MQNLEERINALESGEAGGSKSKGPEPILTCVQCSAEYKESENAGKQDTVQWSNLLTPMGVYTLLETKSLHLYAVQCLYLGLLHFIVHQTHQQG